MSKVNLKSISFYPHFVDEVYRKWNKKEEKLEVMTETKLSYMDHTIAVMKGYPIYIHATGGKPIEQVNIFQGDFLEKEILEKHLGDKFKRWISIFGDKDTSYLMVREIEQHPRWTEFFNIELEVFEDKRSNESFEVSKEAILAHKSISNVFETYANTRQS